MKWTASVSFAFILTVFISFMLSFFLFTDFVEADTVTVIDLKSHWTLKNQNETILLNDLKLPSGVYSALYHEEVLNSYNDINMRWIAYDNWTYINQFEVDHASYKNVRYVNLTLNGIDTVADIYFNNRLIGSTDNMFVRYTFDITNNIQDKNTLEVRLKSPVLVALEKYNELQHKVPPSCPNFRYHGECHMNMLRKMQASFAWDWGLAAPSMGIWKSIVLELYEVALIRDINVDTSKNATHWNMHITVYMDVNGQQDFHAQLIFYTAELLKTPIIINDYAERAISYLSPVIVFNQAIPIENVVIWWPNGYGQQKLYPLHFTLSTWFDVDVPSHRFKTKSDKSIRIGFRTIELVERQAPTNDGNTFLFKVNDVEIFMKGANYIPSHILPELSGDQERMKHLLESAKDAHMNMIRIWGGGIYEHEYFYDLADQLGILIWQDMMFACAMYPVARDFLASVRLETIQNAKRLAHHPSVAIFATNNENEVALVNNWYGTQIDQERFIAEYRELYLDNIMHELKLVENTSRPRPLVSSPSNGKESEKTNFITKNPQSEYYGDVHFYEVLKDTWRPNVFPRPRFASEYGFQSLPSLYAWQRTVYESDNLLNLISHRQHHPLAMLPITNLVMRHLPLPLPQDDNYAEALIYFSQISQAMATKTETELYRSLRDTAHNTMGALYWQLNDVWIAPSWSSIDFYGTWKILHYWAKDFLAPISIVALYDHQNEAINISLICDQLSVDTKDLTISVNTYLWSELLPKNQTQWPATLRPNGVHYDKIIPIKELLIGEFVETNAFFEFELKREQQTISRTYYFPKSIAATEGIKDPALKIEISSHYCITNSMSLTKNTYSLTLTVKHPAVFVFLELLKPYKNVRFSQNGFMQIDPIQVIHLEFDTTSCIRLRKNNLKVWTVNQFMK